MSRSNASLRALLVASKSYSPLAHQEPAYPPPLAYGIEDAVKASGLSRSTLYDLIGEGKLRSVKVAGRRLIPAEALRQLLQGE
jgi:excisionase family DNA binding protein